MSIVFHPQDRRKYWIRRIEYLFDEHNYNAIHYRDENIQIKKLVFHANYLLAKLHIEDDRIEQGETYHAMAKIRMQFSNDAMRIAIKNAKTIDELNNVTVNCLVYLI